MTRISRRGPWLPEEDGALIELVRTQGPNNWVRISQQLQHRSPKQCRERYHQNLKPSLNHEPISAQEGEVIEQLVDEMGKRWAEIARRLGNRSDNAVKNWWNGSMNRRKRTPSQHDHLKHIGNRLHPISSTMPQRSYCGLPRGVTTHQGQMSSSSLHVHNRWSAPESSMRNERALQPPTVRLQSSSASDVLLSRPVQQSSVSPANHYYPTEQQSMHRDQIQRDLESTRLPPLRLPPLSTLTADFSHALEKPLPSPAISEFSPAVSARPTPSLVSDTHSNYSISPKTMVSPRLSAYHTDSTPLSLYKGSRAHSYDYQGVHGQMALSPLHPELTLTPPSSRLDEYRTSRSPPTHHLSTGSYIGYNNLFTPQTESLRDSRMHVSSLVQ
ncbi:hypothetical protein PMZ80_006742 [Knufia obscura]|uniref:Uncharacterized protein n=2 Tax=Knufia TaxID=430999 RepID=A0AAN8E7V6_9EURO|nr:hypothetical protein PMZ80_006742 [Knufia obscura]KAK5948269.1 hypothetical protein OHC33_010703 [Knufia fluminis]